MTAPRISVVLPTMNRRVEIGPFLDTLLEQSQRPHELVVIDAGADRVEDLLVERLAGSGVALVYETSRPGTSVQRNRGIELSSGDLIFFLDDDVRLLPDYIEATLNAFATPSSPPVGAVMGTFANENFRDPTGAAVARLFRLTHHAEGDQSVIYPTGAIRWLQSPTKVVAIPAAATGRVAYRKEALATERFVEFLPGYTLAEDLDLSQRVARHWTLLQTPYARLHHKKSTANRGGMGDRAARVVYSHWYLFRQHQPQDPAHLAAFAWSNVGLAALQVGGALRQGQLRPVLSGLIKGYRLCAKDLRP
jgi:glycosyltransferase involved in cell wall biosynthesis